MIPRKTLDRVHQLTQEYWEQAVTEASFLDLASGKEIGHRIADHVDDETTTMLGQHFRSVRQHKSDGSPMPRSMGDIWIFAGGMYNPINIKSGEGGKKGQPNMVSLKKLLRALTGRLIDSYYLLIIKAHPEGGRFRVAVYLVDMLDFLDFTVFDSGPGQIMLREQQFYDAVDAGWEPPQRTLAEKVVVLLQMLEDADRRLFENRRLKLEALKGLVETYLADPETGIDQTELNLK